MIIIIIIIVIIIIVINIIIIIVKLEIKKNLIEACNEMGFFFIKFGDLSYCQWYFTPCVLQKS